MANPVPVAGGFAAALETFLSRGGSRVSKPRGKPGMRYSEGPVKGLTVEQATQRGREMWAKAPVSVREKYAAQERDMMTRSEVEAEKNRMAAGIEAGSPAGARQFSDGTRRALPGDLNGDGMQDSAQPNPAVPRTPIKGAATPEENAKAQEVAREAAGQYGESAGMSQEEARGQIAGLYSTDKAPNPGVVAPAAGKDPQVHPSGAPGPWKKPETPQVHPSGKAGPWKEPTDDAKPKIAAPLEGVQVGMGKNAGKMNPLTGKPIGYVPPAPPSQQIAGIERVPSAGVTFDPKYGAVPKATEVPEAPMGVDEYNRVKASQDVNDVNALDPRSPEASAARGRMRDYEKQVAAQAASAARRERVGPSPAERDAQQRQARRKLDASVSRSYGAMDGGYLPTKSKA